MMKAEEALALKINGDLNDSKYQLLKNSSLKQSGRIYPSVKVIFDKKSKMLPRKYGNFRNICQVFFSVNGEPHFIKNYEHICY